jgi:hypothetical protein
MLRTIGSPMSAAVAASTGHLLFTTDDDSTA